MIWFFILGVGVVAEIIFTSVLPLTKGGFYHGLELKSTDVWAYLLFLFLNYLALDLCQSTKNYFLVRTSQLLREKKTKLLVVREQRNKGIDNIPQRIQEDVKLMYQHRLTVYVEYIISFGILFWLVSTNLDQGGLIGSAVGYAVITVGIAYLFNNKMKYSERIIQKTEADFRHSLSNDMTLFLFPECLRANITASFIRMNYLLFTRWQGSLIIILPYLFLLPSYLNGQIDLGRLTQMSSMFSLLAINTNILVSMFPILTAGNASKERVEEL